MSIKLPAIYCTPLPPLRPLIVLLQSLFIYPLSIYRRSLCAVFYDGFFAPFGRPVVKQKCCSRWPRLLGEYVGSVCRSDRELQ